MCTNRHKIVLKNVTTETPLTTALILIHGYVDNPCGEKLLTINHSASGVLVTHQLHFSGDFKCLLALSVGLNDVQLSYCNTSISLPLNYTPSSVGSSVIPLYVRYKGHDGHFQSPETLQSRSSPQVACRRIDLMLQLVQLTYAEKLNEAGLGRKSFKIGDNCREYFSDLSLQKALQMSEQELWDDLADEIIRTEGAQNILQQKYVAILSCTQFVGSSDGDNSYETIKKRTLARAAIGGGGLVVFNTGCLYTWPDTLADVEKVFRNTEPVDTERFADDSNYRRTIGGCFATNLGSLCHELGHVFDLGHTEEGIMGRSFDATEKLFLATTAIEGEKKFVLPKRSSPGKDKAQEIKPRVTRVRMSGSVLRDYQKERQCNGIYFTSNCLTILANHKWFLHTAQDNDSINESLGSQEETVAPAEDEKINRGKKTTLEKEKPLLWFSATDRMVTSVHPLRLVELRELGSEMVKHYWELPGPKKEEKTEFKLPLTEQQAMNSNSRIEQSISSRPWILFVIDCMGNTLKFKI